MVVFDIAKNNLMYRDEPIPHACGGKVLESFFEKNVYVMNNHRLAYQCWKTHFDPKQYKRVLMLHIDAHPDAVSSDFSRERIPAGAATEVELQKFCLEELKWDNFLFPYVFEHREKIHLLNLCHESEVSNGFDPECDRDISFDYSVDRQEFFTRLKDASYDAMILDLDLDYFTIEDDEESVTEIWKESDVRSFMSALTATFKVRPGIVTIATSPSCLGCFSITDAQLLERADLLLSIVKDFLI